MDLLANTWPTMGGKWPPIAGHLFIEITQVKQVAVSVCEEEKE